MKPLLNIVLVVPNIDLTGGIEHFGCELANGLTMRGHSITIFTTRPINRQKRSVIPLHNSVNLFYFDYSTPEVTKEQLLKVNPAVCAILYSNKMALHWVKVLHETAIPLLYSEHSNPKVIAKERWNSLERNTLLACSDTIHLFLEEYAASIPVEEQNKIWQIPNFCRYPISKINRTHRAEKIVLSLGRLDRSSKQLHLLIEAFALIQKEHPQWKLQIWGDGEDYNRLNKLIQEKRISSVIQLMGKTDDAAVQYRDTDLFCIPLRYEGFPLTLIEAYTHGLPAVGFAECSGVNSIIQNGLNGFLAPEMTAESLAQALSQLMGDEELLQKMSDAALDRAADFDRKTILPKWEEMLYDCTSHKGNTALQRAMAELSDPESRTAQLHLLWRLNATFEERMEYFRYPLVQYVHYKRDKWFIRCPWKLILWLWGIKNRATKR